MRRKPVLLLFVLFLTFSAVSATGVQASTECEKWLTDYKSQLAKTDAARKLAAAKRRARMKLAHVAPKPKVKVLPARHPRPKMTHEEMMRRFQLACGDLPETEAPPQMLAENEAPFAPPANAWNGPDLGPGDAAFLPNPDSPVFANDTPPDDGGNSLPPGGPYLGAPGVPGGPGGGGSVTPPPCNNGSSNRTSGIKDDVQEATNCGNNPPPPPPVVPEPGSLALVMTGAVSALGMIRSRRRA